VLTSASGEAGPLNNALSTLFEPSPVLTSVLVPQLSSAITSNEVPQPIDSYDDLIDAALGVIRAWNVELRKGFIAGHPRIGETKGLSELSAMEQASRATPPEVLARLAHLNRCYEKRYPGLIYITFVAGRSRKQVAEEMEDKLGVGHSLDGEGSPELGSVESLDEGSGEWNKELERAVEDVGNIAKARAKAT
jgi:2-oxo-4-hydroxy-4-carboxy--5-ureidoimidazoline (OHCU) decarboxylase